MTGEKINGLPLRIVQREDGIDDIFLTGGGQHLVLAVHLDNDGSVVADTETFCQGGIAVGIVEMVGKILTRQRKGIKDVHHFPLLNALEESGHPNGGVDLFHDLFRRGRQTHSMMRGQVEPDIMPVGDRLNQDHNAQEQEYKQDQGQPLPGAVLEEKMTDLVVVQNRIGQRAENASL